MVGGGRALPACDHLTAAQGDCDDSGRRSGTERAGADGDGTGGASDGASAGEGTVRDGVFATVVPGELDDV